MRGQTNCVRYVQFSLIRNFFSDFVGAITYVKDKSPITPHNFFFMVLVCAVCFHFMRSVVLCSQGSWYAITCVLQTLLFPLRVGVHQIGKVNVNLTQNCRTGVDVSQDDPNQSVPNTSRYIGLFVGTNWNIRIAMAACPTN